MEKDDCAAYRNRGRVGSEEGVGQQFLQSLGGLLARSAVVNSNKLKYLVKLVSHGRGRGESNRGEKRAY